MPGGTSIFQDLRSQKLRTLLTAFGIVWGTVAVSLLLAFGKGLHTRQIKNMAGLGDRIVIAWPSRTSLPFEGLGRGRPIRVRDEDLAALRRQVEGLDAISAEYRQPLKASYGGRSRGVDVSGVEPDYGPMRTMIASEGGRFLNARDLAERRRVVFVGDELAADLFGPDDPVGREVLLHGSPFLVVGVLQPKDQDSSYGGRDKSKMLIPATTFRALTGREYVDNIIFRGARPEENAALTRRVTEALAARLRFHPDDNQALLTWDTTEMFVFFNTFMLAFRIFLGFMGALTLVVGGIGVSNIMNVVVDERTREIGIKMALGARGRTILGQFLLETLALTGAGGLLGLAISWAICAIFPRFGLAEYVGDPILSPVLALMTAAALGLVGLIAGYFPARMAARLDPVTAMKR